ncbi:MAG: DUF4342 domain-containing protein [Cyanobacteriota bacterium]|nr:DUF4342 domain-containing protein [Cyanobacteriota bacterium]
MPDQQQPAPSPTDSPVDEVIDIEIINGEPTPGGSHTVEELKISGDALVAKIKELIDQTNVRRILIKNQEGQVLLEIPLAVGVTAGVIGAALFPVFAGLGAIGALVANLTIVVERVEDGAP